jgi:hypothetical protein
MKTLENTDSDSVKTIDMRNFPVTTTWALPACIGPLGPSDPKFREQERGVVPKGASCGSGDRLGSLSYIAPSRHHGGYAGGLIERVFRA